MNAYFTALAVLSALSFPAGAHADTLLFNIVPNPGSLIDTFSFETPSSPVTSTQTTGFVIAANVSIDGAQSQPMRIFFPDFSAPEGHGPLSLGPYEYGAQQQLFTGSDRYPTFIPGSFPVSGDRDEDQVNATQYGTLNITDLSTAVTPEPSSLVLLGTGLPGVFGAAGKKYLKN